jgi:ABC-2 type transport system ATP-binding protein
VAEGARQTREVIGARGVGKRYGAVEALRAVGFALGGPQVIGVLGPNGAGKTTLLEILEGVVPPSEGEVRLFGEPLGRGTYPRRRVGVVMQRESVLDRITVGEYAELFAGIYGVAAGRAQILGEARLAGRERVAVERLSGGEAQRLFLAAAVVHRPELVFLDEPTAHLDPESKGQIAETVRRLGEVATVVLTTHDLREADALCHHVLFLVGGEVKAQGTREALAGAVPPEERRGLGIEDAFFHFCTARITQRGDLE